MTSLRYAAGGLPAEALGICGARDNRIEVWTVRYMYRFTPVLWKTMVRSRREAVHPGICIMLVAFTTYDEM